MNNTKKLIISFVISLFVVLAFKIIWNMFSSNNETEILMLTKDVYKGEKITKEDYKVIKVIGNNNITNESNVGVRSKVAKETLEEGKILNNNDLIDEKAFETSDEKYEYISIEIKDISDAVAYQLAKGQNINVYFTSREVIAGQNVQNIVSDTKTVKVLGNKKIIGLYDSLGREVTKDDLYSAILLRVSSEEAMTISNIKDEGAFNITLIK